MTGLIILYVKISLNSSHIFANNVTSNFPSSSLAMILIMLHNLDLGFELCSYDGLIDRTY